MHFCRQELLYAFTCKDETCSLPSHFLPINTESGNSFVYHLVCRRIVISYQSEINSTFQTVLSASLNHIHHVRLTNNDVHNTFSTSCISSSFTTSPTNGDPRNKSQNFVRRFVDAWIPEATGIRFYGNAPDEQSAESGLYKSIVKILANIGVISFLKLTEIKQQKTGRRNLIKQRRKLLIVKVHHHIIIIPSYGFA